MKKYKIIVFLAMLIPNVLFALGGPINNTTDKNYNNSTYGFSLVVPKNWADLESEYTALKGGKIDTIYITQQSDFSSRRTKYFYLEAGSPGSVFGLSQKVVSRISQEEMVDFYISQLYNSTIGFTVTKTITESKDGGKVFVIESTYFEPGPHKVVSKDYFQFKNDRVYHWSFSYFNTHSQYLPALQKMSDSIIIK